MGEEQDMSLKGKGSISLYFYQGDGKDQYAIKRKITVSDESLVKDIMRVLIDETFADIEVERE